ncbi:MAG: exodeoxyribonuclease III [Patescibacteria group bacterium]|nr:exodeoxyribonuclease III [Patescibacteria group bacterium]
MKIISWNINGIRSAYKKGFLDWFKKDRAEIICLQEVKAQKEQIPKEMENLRKFSFFNLGKRKGYSGVAVYSQKEPVETGINLGLEKFDQEGRMLVLKYPDFNLINIYLPQGGRKKENLSYKLEVYKKLFEHLKKYKDKKVILLGDFNIAHQEIDLARPKQNQQNTMFTPAERKQIKNLIDLGFVDTFRHFYPSKKQYTWWPYFYQARERNIGWRIDYVFVSQKLIFEVKKIFIFSKTKGSDHCPIGIEI